MTEAPLTDSKPCLWAHSAVAELSGSCGVRVEVQVGAETQPQPKTNSEVYIAVKTYESGLLKDGITKS